METNTEMRRKDRLLTEGEAWEVLRGGEHGVLSTLCPDGTPYGVPLSFAVKDRAVYFHGANAESRKVANIQHCPNACFTVVGSTKLLPAEFGTLYMSAVAFGRVRIVEDDAEKRLALEALLHKYSPEHVESGMKYIASAFQAVRVLCLDVETLTGKGRKQ